MSLACLWALLTLGAAAGSTAEGPPRVALLGDSAEDQTAGSAELEADLARLGWPVERFASATATDLVRRLSELNLVIGWPPYDPEGRQALEAHGGEFAQFVRYGGVLLLTGVDDARDVGWVSSIEPGLTITPSQECSSAGEPAPWLEPRHPLLAGIEMIPCVETHAEMVSGLWHILARCADGCPVLIVREIGDGLVVVSCSGPGNGFPGADFLGNLWRWARDGGRIEAARAAEEARYQALRQPRQLEAKRIADPPVIDGILDDRAWQAAARTPPFLNTDGSALADQETVAFIGLDNLWLYVAFECRDTDPSGIRMAATGDGEAVLADDCVELLVDPTGTGESSRQFVVNAAGGRCDAADGDAAWEGWWQGAVQRQPRGWSAELRVPLVTLGDVRTFAPDWLINFGRRYPRSGALYRWAAAPDSAAAWGPAGSLTGVATDLRLFPLLVNQFGLADDVLSASFTNTGDGAFQGSYVVEVTGPSGSRRELVRELSIEAGGSILMETTHQLEKRGTYTFRARVESAGGPVWISDVIVREAEGKP